MVGQCEGELKKKGEQSLFKIDVEGRFGRGMPRVTWGIKLTGWYRNMEGRFGRGMPRVTWGIKLTGWDRNMEGQWQKLRG